MKNFKVIELLGAILVSTCLSQFSWAGGSEGGRPTPLPSEIISGQVLSINKCAWYTPTGSEHDPMWQCAQIGLNSAQDVGQVIEVAFASSNDVAWYNSPKLKGDEIGTFQIQRITLRDHFVLEKFTPREPPNSCTAETKPNCGPVSQEAKCCSISGAFVNLQWLCVDKKSVAHRFRNIKDQILKGE